MNARTLLSGLVPFITSPVGLTVVGVGALGLTIYELLSDKEEKEESVPEITPNSPEPIYEPSIIKNSTVEEPFEPLTTEIDEEALKKEMIRQTMSELGKRSAAKRAKNVKAE